MAFTDFDEELGDKYSEILLRESGIDIPNKKYFLLESPLPQLGREIGVRTFADLLTIIQTVDNVRKSFVDVMTVNETFFYREEKTLRELVGMAIETAQSGVSVKILVAACSSGEEVYTLAIMLSQAMREYNVSGSDISIYGFDISEKMIKKAKNGEYEDYALKATSEEVKREFFEKKDGKYKVKLPLRCPYISFSNDNILASDLSMKYQNFDIISCRNVLFYFDKKNKRRAAFTFNKILRDNGSLFMSFSESPESTFFKAIKGKEVLYYKKGDL